MTTGVIILDVFIGLALADVAFEIIKKLIKRRKRMTYLGMDSFLLSCRQALVRWYNENMPEKIGINDTFVVWSCKTLQNYKCLCSTNVDGDKIYVEYTHNGDKQETYQDIYFKKSNIVLK